MVRRRLLIRPGGIGDLILSLPALEALRAPYTEVWAPRRNVPLVRFADRVREISDTGLDLLEIPGVEPPPSLVEALRSFDSIVSWYGANRSEFRAAAERLGISIRLLPALPPDASRHAADFYLEQAGAPPGAAPRVPCPRRDGAFAVIHPFSGSAAKNWPLENYRRLAEVLRAQIPVRWCAGPEERLAGARRFDNLYDLACWLAEARLYIGNDSGISHLAAAVGTPAVVLFGPTDPRVWAPRGEKVKVIWRPGPMDRISVEEVLNVLSTGPLG